MNTGLSKPSELFHFEIGGTIAVHDAFNILRRYVFVFKIPGVENFLTGSVCHLKYICFRGLDSEGCQSWLLNVLI